MKLTLPDGSVKEFKDGMTPLDIATELAPSLGKRLFVLRLMTTFMINLSL